MTTSRRFFISVALVAVFAANVTYIGGRFFHAPDFFYTARDEVIGADKSVYVSMIEEARQGALLVHNLFTSEPQRARFIAPAWVLFGYSARLLHISALDIFEVSRILVGFFFLLWLGRMCTQFFSEERWARIAFFLLAFSSGIGAFLLPPGRHFFVGEAIGKSLSVDLWQPEMNTFATLMHSTLFIISQWLLAHILFSWVTWEREGGWRRLCALIAATLFLSSIHPYDAVIIIAVLCVRFFLLAFYGRRERRLLWGVVALCVAALLPALLILFLMSKEIALAGWFAQNITIASNALWYLAGYGLLIPLGFYGMLQTRKRGALWEIGVIWFLVVCVLLFLPFQFQRRMLNGAHIPLALLATLGVKVLYERWRDRRFMVMTGAWMLLLGLFGSTFYLIGEQAIFVAERKFPLYVSRDTADAIFWLRDATPRDAVILAAPLNGNLIPALSARRVYAGHGHQTVESLQKRAFLYRWFFTEKSNDRVREFFFRNEGITYLLWTPLERQLGDFHPEEKPYLREVYRNGDVRVYQFIDPRRG